MKIIIFTMVLMVVCFSQQSGMKPWELHGVTSTEWKIAKDNKIPIKKLDELTCSGITIHEYIKHPWRTFDITEKKWIEYRQRGFDDHRIKKESEKKNDNIFNLFGLLDK